MRNSTFKRGFTMIELLVVIVILGVLAGAMVPAVGRFLSAGDDAISRNNLMRLGRAVIAYRAENKNCYPAAGGYFSTFSYKDPETGEREMRNSRSRGWVYFEHNCPRSKGDTEAADKIGDGNHGGYGFGTRLECGSVDGTEVNDVGCCTCFDTTSEEGGIGPQPASWYGTPDGQWSQGQTAIVNGALYEYLGNDLSVFSNPTFEKMAQEKLRIPKSQICRAYAMNVMTGTDKDLYSTDRDCYATGGTGGGGDDGPCVSCGGNDIHAAIRLGSSKLLVYIDRDTREEALPAKTALFVELDLNNDGVKSQNDRAGDQVWDWDEGNESMGFIHEDNGMYYAHVCFADGHVEAIRDPSSDPANPDDDKRKKLSKWYGSGGLSSDGEKLD